MKIIKEVQLKEVWNHWNEVEGQPKENVTWRSDIRCPLPCKHEIRWYLAEVEEQDLKRIFSSFHPTIGATLVKHSSCLMQWIP